MSEWTEPKYCALCGHPESLCVCSASACNYCATEHGHRCPEANTKIYQLEARCRELEAREKAAREVCVATISTGDHTQWFKPLAELLKAFDYPDNFTAETTGEPVGICGTCDDVHDSGYYNHNFVPKMPDEQGCEYCASLEVNPKCPACNGIER